MDKQKVNDILEEIRQSLASFEEKHKVKIAFKGGKYNDNYIRTTMEIAVVKDGEAVTMEAQQFTLYAARYKMKPEWLYQTIKVDGEDHRIIGLKTKCRKYLVLIERVSDGKLIRTVPELIRRKMGETA